MSLCKVFGFCDIFHQYPWSDERYYWAWLRDDARVENKRTKRDYGRFLRLSDGLYFDLRRVRSCYFVTQLCFVG